MPLTFRWMVAASGVTLAGVVGVSAGTTTPVMFERVVEATCEAQIGPSDDRVTERGLFFFDAAGPIDEVRDAILSIGGSLSSCRASQTSTVTPEGFAIEGFVTGSSENDGGLFLCQAAPVTLARYRFEVEDTTACSITGMLDGTGGGSVVFRLDRVFGGENVVLEFTQSESIALSYSGALEPGTYQLRVDASAYIWPGTNQSASFTVEGMFGDVPCAGDFDGSGSVTVEDLLGFLSAWFVDGPEADRDASGGIDVQDLLLFLSDWFDGCA